MYALHLYLLMCNICVYMCNIVHSTVCTCTTRHDCRGKKYRFRDYCWNENL